jgi:hypothetical protein
MIVLIRAVGWVPERADNAHELRRATGGRIVWDTSHDGYDTFLAALAFQGSRDAVHLEDDVTLTSGWRAKAEAVIAGRPDQVIQFFSRRQADLTVGSREEPARTFLAAACFYLPGRLAPGMRAYAATWPKRAEHPTWWDYAAQEYLVERRETYHLHVPSLVQHRSWRSTLGPRSTRRMSASFQP